MTYDVYAMFREGSYLVASSNDRDHGSVVAERVCKEQENFIQEGDYDADQ